MSDKTIPEGATHYIDDVSERSYFKFCRSLFSWVYYSDGQWYTSNIEEYEISVMLKLIR